MTQAFRERNMLHGHLKKEGFLDDVIVKKNCVL